MHKSGSCEVTGNAVIDSCRLIGALASVPDRGEERKCGRVGGLRGGEAISI
jgi:hypothetical protein